MGFSSSSVMTCDCCGYSAPAANGGYTTIATAPAAGPTTAKTYCAAHGCDTGLVNSVNTLIATASTTHKAAIVAGVIPAH